MPTENEDKQREKHERDLAELRRRRWLLERGAQPEQILPPEGEALYEPQPTPIRGHEVRRAHARRQ